MTIKELIEALKDAPPDAEVLIDRGGAYSDARSVNIYRASPGKRDATVFISDEEES